MIFFAFIATIITSTKIWEILFKYYSTQQKFNKTNGIDNFLIFKFKKSVNRLELKKEKNYLFLTTKIYKSVLPWTLGLSDAIKRVLNCLTLDNKAISCFMSFD